jgi:hypothetical protein
VSSSIPNIGALVAWCETSCIQIKVERTIDESLQCLRDIGGRGGVSEGRVVVEQRHGLAATGVRKLLRVAERAMRERAC